jgi:hypothetical protein
MCFCVRGFCLLLYIVNGEIAEMIVFQDWMFNLPMQQQSVLVLACRGPDGIPKFHPVKEIVARYRASVLKAAYLGRAMWVDEGDDTTFMTLRQFSDDAHWGKCILQPFFDNIDAIQFHYVTHLLHGAEIIGYKHPIPLFKRRWLHFYDLGCNHMHVNPETEGQMNARLSDWDQRFWDTKPAGE